MSSPDLPSDLTPEEIQACLKVLNSIHVYDEEHPDYVSVRRATGKMFKAVKRHRRVSKRDLIAEADRAVIAQTATAAPDRIDDETRGNKLAPSTTGEHRRAPDQVPALLHLQAALHPGGRLLPPAVPGVRRSSATASGTPGRT